MNSYRVLHKVSFIPAEHAIVLMLGSERRCECAFLFYLRCLDRSKSVWPGSLEITAMLCMEKQMQKEVNTQIGERRSSWKREDKHFGAFLRILRGDLFVWFVGLRTLKVVSWGQQRLAKVKRQVLVYRTALYSDVQTNRSPKYSLVAWYLNCTLN